MLREIDQIFKWIKELQGVVRERQDPFRVQAERILKAFSAHDISPAQVVRFVPDGLLGEPSALADPGRLNNYLPAAFVNWVAQTLKLELRWLDGLSVTAHYHLDGYKNPARLFDELSGMLAQREEWGSFVIYVFKANSRALSGSRSGVFSVVLQEYLPERDGRELSRYYFLTHGASFDNVASVIHLLEICAIGHHLSIPVRGEVLGRKHLLSMYRMERLVPDNWKARATEPWYPDDALWLGLTGDAEWNRLYQTYLRESLNAAGMTWLAKEIDSERVRLASKRGVATM